MSDWPKVVLTLEDGRHILQMEPHGSLSVLEIGNRDAWLFPARERPSPYVDIQRRDEPSMLQRTQAEIAAHLAEHGEDGSERLALMRALVRLLEKP